MTSYRIGPHQTALVTDVSPVPIQPHRIYTVRS